jgi:hypothetical protein
MMSAVSGCWGRPILRVAQVQQHGPAEREPYHHEHRPQGQIVIWSHVGAEQRYPARAARSCRVLAEKLQSLDDIILPLREVAYDIVFPLMTARPRSSKPNRTSGPSRSMRRRSSRLLRRRPGRRRALGARPATSPAARYSASILACSWKALGDHADRSGRCHHGGSHPRQRPVSRGARVQRHPHQREPPTTRAGHGRASLCDQRGGQGRRAGALRRDPGAARSP